ncbi:hypothetical protein Cni_G09630 [Canna indica]|uniref:Uncharacterized protein n=1 Tax=Canna indica TaxID=4628 RepID=A0AAQ3K5Z9_9LILI|nr:hypothetical protein Cni_G09630 [Canna indica]
MSADEEAVEATLELAILLCDGARRRVATGVPMETRQVEFSKMEPTVPPRREEKGRERGPWRSILVGLMSGTLAAVLVAAVGLSEG